MNFPLTCKNIWLLVKCKLPTWQRLALWITFWHGETLKSILSRVPSCLQGGVSHNV